MKQLRAAGLDTPVMDNLLLQTRELPKLVGPATRMTSPTRTQVYFEPPAGIPDAADEIEADRHVS